jgi:hypothetical protein
MFSTGMGAACCLAMGLVMVDENHVFKKNATGEMAGCRKNTV